MVVEGKKQKQKFMNNILHTHIHTLTDMRRIYQISTYYNEKYPEN